MSPANDSNLSIVFQGPIFGRAGDSLKQRLTKIGLDSARKYFPRAELILSTWHEYGAAENLTGLVFDKLILNTDPGTVLRKDIPPTYNNVNRMIVSSINGLNETTRRFVIKTRSDIAFHHGRVLEYFARYDKFDEQFRICKARICVSQTTTINPRRIFPLAYHVCDWFFFGLREDLLDLFDVPLSPEPEYSRWYETRSKPNNDFDPTNLSRYMAEDYVWSCFLQKHRQIDHEHYCHISSEIIEDSERYLANNVVIMSNRQLGIRSQKYPCYPAPHLLKSYTWKEWLKLYARYGGGPAVGGWDAELAINFSAHWLDRAAAPLFPLVRPWVRRWRELRRRKVLDRRAD